MTIRTHVVGPVLVLAVVVVVLPCMLVLGAIHAAGSLLHFIGHMICYRLTDPLLDAIIRKSLGADGTFQSSVAKAKAQIHAMLRGSS